MTTTNDTLAAKLATDAATTYVAAARAAADAQTAAAKVTACDADAQTTAAKKRHATRMIRAEFLHSHPRFAFEIFHRLARSQPINGRHSINDQCAFQMIELMLPHARGKCVAF